MIRGIVGVHGRALKRLVGGRYSFQDFDHRRLRKSGRFRRLSRWGLLAVGLSMLSACESSEKTAGLIIGLTALGAQSPSSEIQQTYYLGVFDPQEQVQPTVYRVRVHGQSSLISVAKFASGWVPAEFADSLGTSISFDKGSGDLKFDKSNQNQTSFKAGRRLIVFGPEGFRESPANHRLAIAMGSSPETYFNAINEAMGTIASATQGPTGDPDLQRDLFDALEVISEEQKRIAALDERAKGAAR